MSDRVAHMTHMPSGVGVSTNNQCLLFIFTAGVSNILRREGGISRGQMGHFSVGCQFQIAEIESN